jgi:hypothetical protein
MRPRLGGNGGLGGAAIENLSDRRQTPPGWLAVCCILLMALSGVVFVEPAPVDVLVVMLFAAAWMHAWIGIDRNNFWAVILFDLFLVANVVPLPGVDDLPRSVYFLLVTTYLMAAFVLVERLIVVFGIEILRILLWSWVVAAAIVLLISVPALAGVLPGDDFLLYGPRLKGWFKDPNVFGPWLVLPALLCLAGGRDLFPKPVPTAARLVIAILLVLGILLTGSRGALLNLMVAVAALTLFHTRLSPDFGSIFGGALALGAGGIVAGALALGAIEGLGFTSFVSERWFSEHAYDQERFLAQRLALAEAGGNPLGIGPGQSETFSGTVTYIGGRPVSLHSLYLRVVLENGWLGAASFAAFLGLTLARGWSVAAERWRHAGLSAVIVASLLGTLVNSFFVDTLHWRHFWVQMALVWGLSALKRTERLPA